MIVPEMRDNKTDILYIIRMSLFPVRLAHCNFVNISFHQKKDFYVTLHGMHMNWKIFISWVPGIPIAISNGILREYWFQRFLSELPSHQLSAVSFIILFGIYVWFILR